MFSGAPVGLIQQVVYPRGADVNLVAPTNNVVTVSFSSLTCYGRPNCVGVFTRGTPGT